jgi:signal transduction histidine kinase
VSPPGARSPQPAALGSDHTLTLRARSLRRSGWLERHLDEALGALVLISGLIWVQTTKVDGPLALQLLIIAGLALAMVFRRRSPLVFAAASMALALAAGAWVADITQTTWTLYLLLIPGYTVAAYEALPRALLGLAVVQAGPWGVDVLAKHVKFGDFAFTTIVVGVAWVTGRAMRSRRLLHAELVTKAERLGAEREARTRLAVADERTRIARELHAMVATHVSAMVIQAEAAKRTLDHDPGAADRAMLAIEDTGREALGEMRRILGVLRRSGEDPAVLAPQPGVGQIHVLVESARASGASVELNVEGEPGPLPFAVDLAVYRILEEALADEPESTGELSVCLRFAEQFVELEIGCERAGSISWPTVGMSERVASCEGRLRVHERAGGGRRVLASLPRAFEAAYA